MPNADVEATSRVIPFLNDPPIPATFRARSLLYDAAAGAIIYEAGTGIYRVIRMPGIPMPSNRIELAELLWEHAGKPEPVSTLQRHRRGRYRPLGSGAGSDEGRCGQQ